MKKFLIFIIIFSLLSFSIPKKSQAQYVDIPNATKEYGLDTVAVIISKTMLKKLTAKTVNWINNGFKGNPGYIQDPSKFFLDVGDDLASQFLSQAGVNKLCSPFKAQVRLALVKNYIDEDQSYSCTLSVLRNNYDAFTQDFTQGGWEGWFEVTQNSLNNPLGSYLKTKNELAIKIGTQREQKQKQIDLSGGFLNMQRCPQGQEYIDVYGKRKCAVKEETVTPGAVINDQLGKALGSGWDKLDAADEINEVITALVEQMLTQMTGKVSGLFGASERVRNPTGGTTSLTEDIIAENEVPSVNPGPISATQPTINCTATGGNGGGGGGSGGGGNGGNGGSTRCVSTPGTISGVPAWPLGGGSGSGGSSCPAYTPDPSKDCTRVDSGVVMSILNRYEPSNIGIMAAEQEIQSVYPWAFVIPHNAGSGALDKFDFGNGMAADVIIGAINPGVGQGWTWNVECGCNRNPSGSVTPPNVPQLPGPTTYTLTVDITGPGSVSDNVDNCQNLSGAPTNSCSKPYPMNSFVSITATEVVGGTWVGWTGPCAVFNPSKTCSGYITASGAVGAIFR